VSDVAIIDSGGANIASLLFALERLQMKATLTSDASVIRNADKVLLPGVGAAKDAMTRLEAAGLTDVIRKLTQPVLGICLGMQLLCDGSEEENVECLGIIPGVAKKLLGTPDAAVPNMGWCSTKIIAPHTVFENLADGSFFYYLHSYALPITVNTLATAVHVDEFSAVIASRNFVAAQFHPERSSSAGAQMLKNFLTPGL
jgi:glutamine amidotransferase